MKRSKAAAVIFLALIVAGGIGPARADTLISGVNFTASTQLDSGFTPPDVMGAVGPNHIVEFINGRCAVYTKSGQFLQASSLNNFWSSAGAVPAGSYAFDPRILYDSSIQRWYATAADNARGKNNLLFAVSKSADPTAGWWGFKIDPDSSNLRWADFPTLGYNRDAVYLAATLYPIASGSTATTLVVLPKADLLGPVPAISAMTKFEALNPSSTGYVVQRG